MKKDYLGHGKSAWEIRRLIVRLEITYPVYLIAFPRTSRTVTLGRDVANDKELGDANRDLFSEEEVQTVAVAAR